MEFKRDDLSSLKHDGKRSTQSEMHDGQKVRDNDNESPHISDWPADVLSQQ